MATSSIALIIPLVDARRSRKSGSKATDLSNLIAARFSVPRGFVVSADAYRSHLWASGARAVASATAEAEDREKIRSAILTSEVPDDIWSAVTHAYERLSWQTGVPNPPVAVRPSTLEGDPHTAGFEGAFGCYLNVSGLDALKSAIKRVWASVWSGKAAAHRGRQENPAEPAMAVIVQQMLDRGSFGTALTADPLTGDPRRVRVQCAQFGGAVSGADNVVHYTVDLRDLSIVERVDPDPAVLSDDLAKLIAERAILVEDVIPGPVELEWSYDGEKLWVLQARSMPNLPRYTPTEQAQKRQAGSPWRRVTAGPVCPFSRSYLWESPENSAESCLLNGRIYARADDLAATPLTKGVRKEISLGTQMLSDWESKTASEIRSQSTGILDSDIAAADFQTLASTLTKAAETARRATVEMERTAHPAARFPGLLRELLPGEPESRHLLGRLLGGLKDATVLRDAHLQELGERFGMAEESGKIGDEKWWQSYRRDVSDFARTHGYSFRCPGEPYDISSYVSWVEDNDSVFRIIGALARRDKRPSLVTLHGAAEQDAGAAATEAEELIAHADRGAFKDLLRLSRSWLAARNEASCLCALACAALRVLLIEISRRLRESGAIAETNDVFQLTLQELAVLPAEVGDADRAKISTDLARRKHELWLERRLTAPELLREDREGENDVPTVAGASGVPQGRGANPGTTTGRARIVTDVVDAGEIDNGDILLVRAPMLAWTPFLSLAGGLVCETGAPNDSEVILARSYGVPIVVGCEGAIDSTREGQRITIDGSEDHSNPATN